MLVAVATLLTATALGEVNVWLIPHAHCDVGWLQTFDDLGRLNVSRILDTVTKSLLEDETRRFAWSEVAFFQYWWVRQSAATQTAFKGLVARGQMEFVDGGWSQHDMGCTDYDGMFNNMETGHLFLRDTFAPLDVRPRVGWSVDPFGISATQAVFYSLMGMDSYVYTRINQKTISEMQADRTLEFAWEASSSLGTEDTVLMSHVLESYYCSPGNFRFDSTSVPTPTTADGFAKLAAELTAIAIQRSAWFQTSNVLIPWGCDYMFQDAPKVYLPSEQVMSLMNANTTTSGVSVRYGTPSEYMNTIRNEKKTAWPIARTYPGAVPGAVETNGDFFPYTPSPGKDGSWSGYLTSRPLLKRLSRVAHTDMYVAERLAALAAKPVVNNTKMLVSRRGMGIVQHHDAITGSPCSAEEGCVSDQDSGEHDVLESYERMCTAASAAAGEVAAEELRITPTTQYDFGNRLLDGRNATLVVTNPVASQRTEVVEVKIPICAVAVTETSGAAVVSQVGSDLTVSDGSIYYFTLRMMVSLAPWETKSYNVNPCVAAQRCKGWRGGAVCYATDASTSRRAMHEEVRRLDRDQGSCPALAAVDVGDREQRAAVLASCAAGGDPTPPPPPPPVVSIENDFIKLTVNVSTGPIEIVDKTTGTVHPFKHELLVYRDTGNAYTFQPDDDATPVLGDNGAQTFAVAVGVVFSEVRMKLNNQHKVWYRVWHSQDADVAGRVEVGYRVGVLDQGTALSSRFTTAVDNARVLYSESNGYEVQRRAADLSFPNKNCSIPANFFPSQMSFFIKDHATQLSVAVDRSRAVASLRAGEAELLLHRRNIEDVSVILDDVTRNTHHTWVSIGRTNQTNRLRQQMKLRMAHPISLLFASKPVNVNAGLPSLPDNIHLQSLKLDSNGTVLLRLMHVYAKGEDPELSVSTDVNLLPFLESSGRSVLSVVEMCASGMVPLSSVHRPSWQNDTKGGTAKEEVLVDPTRIVMVPFAVRTFSVTLG